VLLCNYVEDLGLFSPLLACSLAACSFTRSRSQLFILFRGHANAFQEKKQPSLLSLSYNVLRPPRCAHQPKLWIAQFSAQRLCRHRAARAFAFHSQAHFCHCVRALFNIIYAIELSQAEIISSSSHLAVFAP
jgi:hypothetical protein